MAPPPSSICFFFQAEDGIRDRNVTGVQTCALPICQLVLVVEPGHPQQQFLVARPALADIWFGPHGMPPPSAGHEVIEIGRASCRERVKLWAGGASGKTEHHVSTGGAETRI